MTQEEMAKAYQQFFTKTEPGKQFIDMMNRLIADAHERAENDPELARDHVQRAKGVREVVNLLNSLMAIPKKGRSVTQ